jgi:hypothetical protein
MSDKPSDTQPADETPHPAPYGQVPLNAPKKNVHSEDIHPKVTVAAPPDAKPAPEPPVHDEIHSADARKSQEHGGHPVSREQDETGTKAPAPPAKERDVTP